MNFLSNKNLLITASKDKFVRFWNLKGASEEPNQYRDVYQNNNDEFDMIDPDYSDQIEPEPQSYQRPQTNYSQTSTKKPKEESRNDDPLSKQSLGNNYSQNQVSQQQSKNQQPQPQVQQNHQHPESDEDEDLAGWND